MKLVVVLLVKLLLKEMFVKLLEKVFVWVGCIELFNLIG